MHEVVSKPQPRVTLSHIISIVLSNGEIESLTCEKFHLNWMTAFNLIVFLLNLHANEITHHTIWMIRYLQHACMQRISLNARFTCF